MRTMLAFRTNDNQRIRIFIGESCEANPDRDFYNMLLTPEETRSLRDMLNLELELYDLMQPTKTKDNDHE